MTLDELVSQLGLDATGNYCQTRYWSRKLGPNSGRIWLLEDGHGMYYLRFRKYGVSRSRNTALTSDLHSLFVVYVTYLLTEDLSNLFPLEGDPLNRS